MEFLEGGIIREGSFYFFPNFFLLICEMVEGWRGFKKSRGGLRRFRIRRMLWSLRQEELSPFARRFSGKQDGGGDAGKDEEEREAGD